MQPATINATCTLTLISLLRAGPCSNFVILLYTRHILRGLRPVKCFSYQLEPNFHHTLGFCNPCSYCISGNETWCTGTPHRSYRYASGNVMRPPLCFTIDYVMFRQLPLIYFALEAHSVIERLVNKKIFELWNEEYRDGIKQDRDDSLHYKAGETEVLCRPLLTQALYCHLVVVWLCGKIRQLNTCTNIHSFLCVHVTCCSTIIMLLLLDVTTQVAIYGLCYQ